MAREPINVGGGLTGSSVAGCRRTLTGPDGSVFCEHYDGRVTKISQEMAGAIGPDTAPTVQQEAEQRKQESEKYVRDWQQRELEARQAEQERRVKETGVQEIPISRREQPPSPYVNPQVVQAQRCAVVQGELNKVTAQCHNIDVICAATPFSYTCKQSKIRCGQRFAQIWRRQRLEGCPTGSPIRGSPLIPPLVPPPRHGF